MSKTPEGLPALARHKPFLKTFEGVTQKYMPWQIWSDFVEATAISIANAVDTVQAPTREETWRQIMERYNSEERERICQLVAYTVDALEKDPHQDFLGTLFMCLALGNHWKGQFFTPYAVCQMMAEAQITEDLVEEALGRRGFVSVTDPSCGAGATLIAARNRLSSLSVGGDRAWFVAQDIDRTAGLMCYIQLSLLGCAGYVCIGDSLLHPTVTDGSFLPRHQEGNDLWYFPGTFMGVWPGRIQWARMVQTVEGARLKAEKKAQNEPEQLTLF